jgi:SAM-dependent methyltransferase
MNDWFTLWFGREYLELYPHRDEAEARDVVALVRRTIGSSHPGRILDLACGSGRHARVLREWGWTVGFDLSSTLLGLAREESPDAPYVRGDMRRLPFADGVFGVVVNLFTSFGYFDADADHLAVLREVARVTRRHGTFVLDFLNEAQVRATLVPADRRVVDHKTVRQRRWITSDGRYVLKSISADHGGHTYVERVRLYTPAELHTLITAAGFTVTHEFGDYEGGVRTDDSPRAIFFAERG